MRRASAGDAKQVNQDASGSLSFALFTMFLAFILPLLGPRVPQSYHRTNELLAEVSRSQGVRGGVVVKVEEVFDPRSSGASGTSLILATARAESGQPNASMLVVANEHGRELVTAEIALGTLKALTADNAEGETWRRLLDRGLELSIVPVANVEGRQLAETWRPCQRGTSDVPFVATDINRNFATDWTPGVQYNYLNSSFDFHGTAPFSSSQARILGSIASRHGWDAFVDLHSGSEALNLPYGTRPEGSRDKEEQTKALAEVRKFCPNCRVGPSKATMGYDNPGQMADWMYEDQGVTYSYVWETYACPGLCAPHFNPMDDSELADVMRRWNGALASLAEYVLDHPRTRLDQVAS